MEIRINGSIALYQDGKKVSWVDFTANLNEIELLATFTNEEEKGKGYASLAVENALLFAKKFDKIKISCPYIKNWIEKHGFERDLEFTNALKFKEAVEKFNYFRSPEAVAEILEIKEDFALIKITGPFCVSCGVFDYFEDISVDADARIEEWKEVEDGFLVKYKLKGGVKND